jgi:hypothetical protein
MAEPAVTSLTPAPTQTITAPSTFSLPPGPPQYDAIELMPDQCAELMRQLRDRSSDAHGLMVPFSELREASMARVLADQRLRTLQGHPQEFGHNLPDGHASVVQAKRTLQKATAEFARLNERAEVKAAAWRSVAGALAHCEGWLKEGRPGGTSMEFCPTEPPQPAKGDTLLDLIEKLRRRGRELQADASRISSAQFPAAFVKAKMRESISRLAEAGRPNIDAMVEHDGPLSFATQRLQTTMYGENHSQQHTFGEVNDSTALICWLHRDEIVRRLEKEIDAEVDPNSTPLSYQQREQHNAEIGADILAVEREEAAAVWLAMSHGLPAEHRADCSPLAILQIRLVTVTNGHAPETSTPHAYDVIGVER